MNIENLDDIPEISAMKMTDGQIAIVTGNSFDSYKGNIIQRYYDNLIIIGNLVVMVILNILRWINHV